MAAAEPEPHCCCQLLQYLSRLPRSPPVVATRNKVYQLNGRACRAYRPSLLGNDH